MNDATWSREGSRPLSLMAFVEYCETSSDQHLDNNVYAYYYLLAYDDQKIVLYIKHTLLNCM